MSDVIERLEEIGFSEGTIQGEYHLEITSCTYICVWLGDDGELDQIFFDNIDRHEKFNLLINTLSELWKLVKVFRNEEP